MFPVLSLTAVYVLWMWLMSAVVIWLSLSLLSTQFPAPLQSLWAVSPVLLVSSCHRLTRWVRHYLVCCTQVMYHNQRPIIHWWYTGDTLEKIFRKWPVWERSNCVLWSVELRSPGTQDIAGSDNRWQSTSMTGATVTVWPGPCEWSHHESVSESGPVSSAHQCCWSEQEYQCSQEQVSADPVLWPRPWVPETPGDDAEEHQDPLLLLHTSGSQTLHRDPWPE